MRARPLRSGYSCLRVRLRVLFRLQKFRPAPFDPRLTERQGGSPEILTHSGDTSEGVSPLPLRSEPEKLARPRGLTDSNFRRSLRNEKDTFTRRYSFHGAGCHGRDGARAIN